MVGTLHLCMDWGFTCVHLKLLCEGASGLPLA